MKKIVFILPLMLAALSCFAEIRVYRDGRTEGGITVNVAAYWNDKYTPDKTELVIRLVEVMTSFTIEHELELKALDRYFVSLTTNYYYDSKGKYEVYLNCLPNNRFWVRVSYTFNDAPQDSANLYNKTFYSFNDAKAQFDYLCKKYYNEIPK